MSFWGQNLTDDQKKARNFARWCALAEHCTEQCQLCHWPLEPDVPGLEGARIKICNVCRELVQILSSRTYWVRLESNEATRRRQMGLDN